MARCGRGNQVDGNAEPLAELAPQVDREAAVFAARRILLHEKEITVVDADAELSSGSELGFRGGGERHEAKIARARRRCPPYDPPPESVTSPERKLCPPQSVGTRMR